MDKCIECKIEKTKTILLCDGCDEKLNMIIKKKMRENWNWPFDRNDISKQQMRNHN